MPVLDGFEVLAELKAQEANTVVIVISADIQPQAVARVLSLGASGFLKKPLQEAELRQMFIKVGLL
jgi:CheY-like chemotaxis protein